jgi:hypothetical protein
MKTWFDEDSRPVAVDETHPVDFLEPEPEPSARSTPDVLTMIERIGGSFIRGNPFIIQVAWRILLNKESKSMRACARHLGCTPQAISKRVRLLAEKFGYPISDKRLREMRRMVAQRSWAERKRREDRNPPAASDDQSKTDTPATPDKRPSVNAGGVNDLSDFSLNPRT